MLENNKEQLGKKKIEETKIKIHDFKKVSNSSVFIYKHFKFIIFLEVLLILIMGYLFIIRTELLEIENYNNLVLEKQEELEKIKEYRDDFLEFKEQYNIIEKEVERDINKLYDILPPKENLPDIMAQIEALVNNHGFVLGSIDISSKKSDALDKNNLPLIISGEVIKTSLIKEVDINVFIFDKDGGYERVKELLDAFERHIRFIDIISFGFEVEMKTYSIILKTYYLNYEE